jgi:hypothetical protein
MPKVYVIPILAAHAIRSFLLQAVLWLEEEEEAAAAAAAAAAALHLHVLHAVPKVVHDVNNVVRVVHDSPCSVHALHCGLDGIRNEVLVARDGKAFACADFSGEHL